MTLGVGDTGGDRGVTAERHLGHGTEVAHAGVGDPHGPRRRRGREQERGLGEPDRGQLGDSLRHTHASFETPCGAYGHFKITRYLLCATKDSRYGDSMERVLYNTILGAWPIQADGTSFYYSD